MVFDTDCMFCQLFRNGKGVFLKSLRHFSPKNSILKPKRKCALVCNYLFLMCTHSFCISISKFFYLISCINVKACLFVYLCSIFTSLEVNMFTGSISMIFGFVFVRDDEITGVLTRPYIRSL